ncbi:hypothetical protein PFISCL1PPCAC_5389, partial [Pristionchus fissidentatus]
IRQWHRNWPRINWERRSIDASPIPSSRSLEESPLELSPPSHSSRAAPSPSGLALEWASERDGATADTTSTSHSSSMARRSPLELMRRADPCTTLSWTRSKVPYRLVPPPLFRSGV